MTEIRTMVCAAVALGLILGMALPARAAEKIVFGTSTGGGIRFLTDTLLRLKLDKKHGIDLDFKYFAGPKGNQALLFKKVDASYFSGILAAKRSLDGDPYVNFEIMMNSHVSFMVLPDSNLTSIEQLRGKRLGFFTRASSIYMLFAIAS